jgi:hypothetical protein
MVKMRRKKYNFSFYPSLSEKIKSQKQKHPYKELKLGVCKHMMQRYREAEKIK